MIIIIIIIISMTAKLSHLSDDFNTDAYTITCIFRIAIGQIIHFHYIIMISIIKNVFHSLRFKLCPVSCLLSPVSCHTFIQRPITVWQLTVYSQKPFTVWNQIWFHLWIHAVNGWTRGECRWDEWLETWRQETTYNNRHDTISTIYI